MEKILIKFIYFLLRFVKSDISSLSIFMEDCGKIAGDKYHTVQVEYSKHSDLSEYIKFTAYIDGYDHKYGSTPKECLDKFAPSNKKTVKTVID